MDLNHLKNIWIRIIGKISQSGNTFISKIRYAQFWSIFNIWLLAHLWKIVKLFQRKKWLINKKYTWMTLTLRQFTRSDEGNLCTIKKINCILRPKISTDGLFYIGRKYHFIFTKITIFYDRHCAKFPWHVSNLEG